MTNQETLSDLKSQNKPYAHLNPEMKQSHFSAMCVKIENGLCKPKTVREFFAKFRYVGDWNNFEKI